MGYHLVGRVHVAVHATESPTDAEWDAYLKDLAQNFPKYECLFVATDGGSLNGAQRNALDRFWRSQKRRVPIAVVTPSRVVRAMVNAMSFVLHGVVRSFAPDERDKVFRYLGLSDQERQEVEAAETVITLALKTRRPSPETAA